MSILTVIGAAIIVLLGAVHLLYTVQSKPDGGKMTPTDERVQSAMQLTGGLGLAPHIDSSLWRAWVGFNLSHSVGVIVGGLLIGLPALVDFDAAIGSPGWVVAAVVLPPTYLVISIRYWFREPTVGIAAAGSLIVAGVCWGLLAG